MSLLLLLEADAEYILYELCVRWKRKWRDFIKDVWLDQGEESKFSLLLLLEADAEYVIYELCVRRSRRRLE